MKALIVILFIAAVWFITWALCRAAKRGGLPELDEVNAFDRELKEFFEDVEP